MTVIDCSAPHLIPTNSDVENQDTNLLLDLELLSVDDPPFDIVQHHFQLYNCYEFGALTVEQQNTDL